MTYILTVDLYTNGDYYLNEEVFNQVGSICGCEEARFSWIIQTLNIDFTPEKVISIAEQKVKEIQKSIVISNIKHEKEVKEHINALFNGFYNRLHLDKNKYLEYPVESYSFGNWEGTKITLAPAGLILVA